MPGGGQNYSYATGFVYIYACILLCFSVFFCVATVSRRIKISISALQKRRITTGRHHTVAASVGTGVVLWHCLQEYTAAAAAAAVDVSSSPSHAATPPPLPHRRSVLLSALLQKRKCSPHSIAKRRVPELIPVLGSQPVGDVSHKPGGRLPLLSARPTVTLAILKMAATSFAAW